MRKNYYKLLCHFLLSTAFCVSALNLQVKAQCASGIASGTACSGGGGALTNNYTFNSANETRWVSGAGGSLGTTIINATGCTLRVCGSVTLTDLQLNTASAVVVIESGGSLSMSGAWSPAQGEISNYGTITVAGDLTMNGTKFYNATTSSSLSLTGGGRTLTVNNSAAVFTNRGKILTNNFTIQASGANIVCIENGSCINANGTFTNNQTNSIKNGSAAPTKGAIVYTSATFNNSLTTYASVYICQNGGSSPANKGSATFSSNCSSTTNCSVVLPIELLTFNVHLKGEFIELTWASGVEINNDFYTVERSLDGITFEEVIRIKGRGNSDVQIDYATVDFHPFNGTSYYRLKQSDFDGKFQDFNIVAVKKNNLKFNYSIFPNPLLGNEFYIKFTGTEFDKDVDILITIYDKFGQRVYGRLLKLDIDKPIVLFDASEKLSKGVYIVKVNNNNCQKLIVE